VALSRLCEIVTAIILIALFFNFQKIEFHPLRREKYPSSPPIMGVYIVLASEYNAVVTRALAGLDKVPASQQWPHVGGWYLLERSNKMAKPNFNFQKRQKEIAKKKKNEEKRQRKLDKNTIQPAENPVQSPNEGEIK
jgi:hypothetical protein